MSTSRRVPTEIVCLGMLALMCAISEAGEPADTSGAQLYKEFCATCHGVSGHGNGPVALSLKQRVPDLTLLAKRWGGAFPAEEVHRMIDGRSMPRAHGTTEMPIWGWEFYGYEGEDAARRRHVAELIDRLVEYLGSIQNHVK
jgi:mono/diheme cytochrome c family protein